MSRAAFALPFACALVFVACASDSDDADAPTSNDSSTVSEATTTAAATTTTTEPPPPDTEAPETTTSTTSTTTTTVAPTTTLAAEPMQIELPAGPILADADDAFVVTPGGVLYWHRDLFAETAGEPLRVAGTAANNNVESVAGVVDGAVILGLCCAAPEGQVSATTGEAAVAVSRGWRSALDPDGAALATVGDRTISVVDLTTGTGLTRELPADQERVPLDVIWSGTSPILLADQDGELVLSSLDAETLSPGAAFPTGLTYDEDTYAEFAGYGPSGEVAIVHAAGNDADVTLQAYAVATLEPVDTLTRTLPAGVRSVRVRSAGDVIWVDQGTVWHTVGGESQPLGGGATAVWFAAS